jgi:CrcB protein
MSNPVVLDPDLEPESPPPPHPPSLRLVALVFLGGFLGTLARYAVLFYNHPPPHSWDPTILLINVSGAFVLGVLGATLFASKPEWVGLRLAVGTGFLGGWTTYSAVISGSLTLAHHSAHLAAGLNLLLELVVPVLGAGLGLVIGSLFSQRKP